MIGSYDFCGHYDWTFAWFLRNGGPAALRRYWEEAIARVVSMAMSPAAKIVSALKGPAAGVAGQVKTISEKKEETAEAAPPAA